MRPIYFIAGIIMLGFGLAGIVLPLLPATPFLLAAAWLFGRSSPRLEHWLLNHKLFGATLRNWQRDRAIAPRAKALAVLCMALSFAIVLPGGTPAVVKVGIGIILVGCAAFVVSRPSPTRFIADPAHSPRQSVAAAPRS
jgi:uncharacterized membrane protein YbaN (DUF454 family)